MKQWMKWMCIGALATTMACGDYDDDTKVSELEDSQVTEVCNDVCGGAGPWEFECDGLTLSGDEDKASCVTACAGIKGVKDSCAVTVGQLRTAFEKPSNCSEAQAGLAVSIQLAACL